MVSIVCDECGAEARQKMDACPRCGLPFPVELPRAAEAPMPAPAHAAPNRLRALASVATVCLLGVVGVTVWMSRPPSAARPGLVAVGKVESGAASGARP
jgi:hypothetical protein